MRNCLLSLLRIVAHRTRPCIYRTLRSPLFQTTVVAAINWWFNGVVGAVAMVANHGHATLALATLSTWAYRPLVQYLTHLSNHLGACHETPIVLDVCAVAHGRSGSGIPSPDTRATATLRQHACLLLPPNPATTTLPATHPRPTGAHIGHFGRCHAPTAVSQRQVL